MKIITALLTSAVLATTAHAGPGVPTPIENVSFAREGVRLRGDIHHPARAGTAARLPAVVIAGPWTQIRGMSLDLYAREFAAQGYRALTFGRR
jgi:dienelactone hydrolase